MIYKRGVGGGINNSRTGYQAMTFTCVVYFITQSYSCAIVIIIPTLPMNKLGLREVK